MSLRLQEITKRFDQRLVLDTVSLELAEGELLVLLGASGCGKSTLLRIIAGLESADSGHVHIGGRRVDQLPPKDRNVALVFQNYALYPHMTVRENLAFPLTVIKTPKTEIAERVNQTAALLDLADRLADRPAQLSGGQRQRVALGRAIIRQPAIFLLDEPLSNLDAELRVRMRQEIVRLQRQVGRAMIHVTHDQTEALTMADRIGLLHEGKLIQIGTPEDLYRRPQTTFVASFLGQPRINLLTGHVENERLQPYGIPAPRLLYDGPADVTIGIRPETWDVRPDGELLGHVIDSEYLGDQYVMTLDLKGTPIRVRTLTAPPEHGHPVRLGVKLDELLFFDPASGARRA